MMSFAFAGLAVAVVLVAVGAFGELTLLERSFRREREAWTVERRELLNRIQRPEMVPQTVPEQWVAPEPEPDESNLVGTIAEPDGDE